MRSAPRHRLDLIVGDADHGRLRHRFVQLGDLDAGGDAQRRVRFDSGSSNRNTWVAHDGAADGDALALAADIALGSRSGYLSSCRISAARARRSISAFNCFRSASKAMLS